MEMENIGRSLGTTKDFAESRHVEPQTVLKRLCKTGSYFGIKPIRKLENGRWEWQVSAQEPAK